MSTAHPASQGNWRVIALASLGGALELYDFIIYGIFAQQIASQFFPSQEPLVSLLSTFGVFAIGYVSRPLGGIVLSSFGDRYGRRVVFIISIFGMSVCTLGIGLIPGYAQVGILAPMLLILLRTFQGFFLAGELPCSITYVVEEMPHRASLVSGMVILCLNCGVLIATLVSFILHKYLDAADMAEFGWRVAFIIGGCFGLGSFWIRRTLSESNEFKKIKSDVVRQPFRTVLKERRPSIVRGICLAGVANATNCLLFVVLPSYMTRVIGFDASEVASGQNLGVGMLAISIAIIAWAGDKIPSHLLHRLGCIIVLVGAYPLYSAMVGKSIGPTSAFMILGVVGGFFSGTYAYLLASLFDTRIRFTGIGLTLNLATVLFTGITPYIVTKLIEIAGNPVAPAWYLMVVAVIGLLGGMTFRAWDGHKKPFTLQHQA